MRTWKGIDVVINNAGILNDCIWETQIAINCVSIVEIRRFNLIKPLTDYFNS